MNKLALQDLKKATYYFEYTRTLFKLHDIEKRKKAKEEDMSLDNVIEGQESVAKMEASSEPETP